MTRSNSVLRLAILSVAFALAAGVASTTARAKPYSLSGDARLQVGNGLPLPIGATPPPNGRIQAIPGAVVFQSVGPDPVQMTIPPGQLTAPGNLVVVGLFVGAVAVGQVQTSVAVSLPGPAPGGVFKAGGRTGAATVTFCPGQVVTSVGNPACPSPGAGVINGLMRYTKTANQFGGAAQSGLAGGANIAHFLVTPPPCSSCPAVFLFANPAPIGAQGAPFGFANYLSEPAPDPSGQANVNANAAGTITQVITSNLGPGFSNDGTSFGGPWTTGRLTIQVTAALGGAETFVFSGMDSRVGGIGPISLVSGAIAARSWSGPNASRGWLNLRLGNIAVPALSRPGLAAAFGLLGLAGAYALRRGRRC